MLENLILLVTTHPGIKGIKLFEHCFLYSAYAEGIIFLLKDALSIENLCQTFSLFSGLKTDLTKQEIVGLGVLLKGVQMAVRGMRCVDLCNEAIRILGCYFSYNNRIKEGHNFLRILPNVQSVNSSDFKISLKIGIVVFKSLAILKIAFQALIAPVSRHISKALETIQTYVLWNNSDPKIKQNSLQKLWEGGLKNIDIQNKLNSLHS